jgi:hypothetical protein
MYVVETFALYAVQESEGQYLAFEKLATGKPKGLWTVDSFPLQGTRRHTLGLKKCAMLCHAITTMGFRLTNDVHTPPWHKRVILTNEGLFVKRPLMVARRETLGSPRASAHLVPVLHLPKSLQPKETKDIIVESRNLANSYLV